MIKNQRRRSRDISGSLQDFIENKAINERWTAKQIFNHMDRLRGDKLAEFLESYEADKIPEYSQVWRIVKDVIYPDTSGVWSPSDEDTNPEDVRCILDVLHEVIIHTEGRKTVITNNEAARIVRLSKAMPSADPWLISQVTQLYLVYESKEQSTAALDTFIAFKPWQDNCLDAYIQAFKEGIIPLAPLASWLLPGITPSVKIGSNREFTIAVGLIWELQSSGLTVDEIAEMTGLPKAAIEFIFTNTSEIDAILKEDQKRVSSQIEEMQNAFTLALEGIRPTIRLMQEIRKQCSKWNESHPDDILILDTLLAEHRAYRDKGGNEGISSFVSGFLALRGLHHAIEERKQKLGIPMQNRSIFKPNHRQKEDAE